MGLTSQQYAHLADHSYDRGGQMQDLLNKDVVIGGERYRVIDYVDNPRTGYQGTIYQHEATGAVVAAHRGTEFGREAFRDGVIADAGMVFTRTNSQAADAVELTRRAVEYAERQGREPGRTAPEVTVTGHSLGGTLAQVSAHHFDLRGETFNAYGAASLDRRIPEGGDRVTNHVMAVDAVSSASPHYGQLRIYATPTEIETLHRTGYHDNVVRDLLQRDMPLTASVLSGGSHSMHNFLPVDGDGRPDRSALDDPAARRLAEERRGIIADYRDDVGDLRRGVTVTARGPVGLVLDGIDRIRGPVPAGEPAARDERERQDRTSQAETPHRNDAALDAPQMSWRPSPEVERLLAAAAERDPAALQRAQHDLHASPTGQAWRERVEAHQRDLAAHERAPDFQTEQRTPAQMDIAR